MAWNIWQLKILSTETLLPETASGKTVSHQNSDFGINQTLNDCNYYVIPVRWMPTESFNGKFSINSEV